MYFGLWIYISTTLGCALYWTKYTFPLLQETYANILACDYTTNEPEFEDISDEAKGGLISESFSLYLKSPKMGAKSLSILIVLLQMKLLEIQNLWNHFEWSNCLKKSKKCFGIWLKANLEKKFGIENWKMNLVISSN